MVDYIFIMVLWGIRRTKVHRYTMNNIKVDNRRLYWLVIDKNVIGILLKFSRKIVSLYHVTINPIRPGPFTRLPGPRGGGSCQFQQLSSGEFFNFQNVSDVLMNKEHQQPPD